MQVGSLFSGIGGIELGLEMASKEFQPAWFVEREPYAQSILKRHWPEVKIYDDITRVNWNEVERVDVLTGGFPCQDISNAGKRVGIQGSRSGLWKEMFKAIRILRPRLVIAENVSALLNRGLNVVLADLASLGYNAEWDCIPASAVGAPHRRDRIFIVAYPRSVGSRAGSRNEKHSGEERELTNKLKLSSTRKGTSELADSYGCGHLHGQPQEFSAEGGEYAQRELESSSKTVANSDGGNAQTHRTSGSSTEVYKSGENEFSERSNGEELANTNGSRLQATRAEQQTARTNRKTHDSANWWAVEPDVGRVVNGIPRGMDSRIWKERIKSLGNAVVPQVAERIGRIIIRSEVLK